MENEKLFGGKVWLEGETKFHLHKLCARASCGCVWCECSCNVSRGSRLEQIHSKHCYGSFSLVCKRDLHSWLMQAPSALKSSLDNALEMALSEAWMSSKHISVSRFTIFAALGVAFNPDWIGFSAFTLTSCNEILQLTLQPARLWFPKLPWPRQARAVRMERESKKGGKSFSIAGTLR